MKENKHPKKNASTTENMLISGVKQVFPKEATGVEPQADNNILKVTEHCLYALSSADRENTGRANGAWWFIWMMVFMIGLYLFTMLPDLLRGTSQNSVEEHILFGGGGCLFLLFSPYPFLFVGAESYLFVLTEKPKKYQHGLRVSYYKQTGIR